MRYMYITYVYGCTVESVTNAIDNFSKEHNYNTGSFSSKNSYYILYNIFQTYWQVYACAAADDRSLTVGRAGAVGCSSYLA